MSNSLSDPHFSQRSGATRIVGIGASAGAVKFGTKRGRKTVNIEAVETVDAS